MKRRFGEDADARWKAFRGGLQDWHRLDILVRDAAVRSPAGFAPRIVFDLPALADDEPCGPDWPGPAPAETSALLLGASSSPRDLSAALDAAAAAWGLAPQPLPPTETAEIKPATRLLIAGTGAVLSVAAACAGNRDLDLGDQAALNADDPGTRQIFGLALAMLDSRRPPRLARSLTTAAELRAAGLPTVDRVFVSGDAPGNACLRLNRGARARGADLTMALSADRIITPGQTPHAHERDAFDFVVRELPDTDPYRLWAFVDLIDGSGRRYDLDLLILGYHALYLVEVKSHVGTLTGDEVDWSVTFPDGGRTTFENPLRTTTHKARVLSSLLDLIDRDHDVNQRGLHRPWVPPLVFLSGSSLNVNLTPAGGMHVVTRRNLREAITRGEFPGSPDRLRDRSSIVLPPWLRSVCSRRWASGPHQGAQGAGPDP
jgi:hypothetical protein